MGGLDPVILNETELNMHKERLSRSFKKLEFSNPWDEFFTKGMYENFKFWQMVKSEPNPENAEPLIKKTIEYFSKIPNDGEYLVNFGNLNLGNFYRLIGKFKESEFQEYLREALIMIKKDEKSRKITGDSI